MSDFVKEHSNGNASGSFHRPKKPAPPAPQPGLAESANAQVVAQTVGGLKLQGAPLRVARHNLVFEIYHPEITPQLSEIFDPLKLVLQERALYSGRAVVRNVIHAGAKVICEVMLTETAWLTANTYTQAFDKGRLLNEFSGFVQDWQKFYLVNNEYKLVIADIQTFLMELSLWIGRLESLVRSGPAENHERLENEIADSLRGPVGSALGSMFEKFEAVARTIDPDLHPLHRAFGQRQLHPLLLCAPFIHRTLAKPLGYAGDYEMMNMIVRNKLEGQSIYAKLVNAYLLDQAGPEAVRGRVGFLEAKIAQETGRLAGAGKVASVFCIACGPAWEAVNFVAEHPLAESARFEMLDFNEETLAYTKNKFEQIKRQHRRKTEVTFVKKSVQNLLRAKERDDSGKKYDLIYCSGLYDYLSDNVCQALNTYLYNQLEPGGLLVVGNFAPNTPVINFIEHFLEWFLIYRDGRQLAALAPENALRENCVVRAEPTTNNIFLEVRKPG